MGIGATSNIDSENGGLTGKLYYRSFVAAGSFDGTGIGMKQTVNVDDDEDGKC
jgi:hypothetical protein